MLQPPGTRLFELPERAGHDADGRDGLPARAELLDGTARIDTFAARCLGLSLANESELGFTQSHRLMGVLDPYRDRRSFFEVVGIVEHDGALNDLAGPQAHSENQRSASGGIAVGSLCLRISLFGL